MSLYAYVGGFTRTGAFNGRASGISVYEVDSAAGRFDLVDVCEIADPTWLTSSGDGRFLVAGLHGNVFRGEPGTALVSYSVDPVKGTLMEVSSQRLAHPHVAHLHFDRSHRYLIAASSLGGTVSAVAIGEDGSFLGVLDTWAAEGEPAVGAGQTPVSVDVKDGNFPGQRSPARLVRGRTTQPHAVEIHQSNRFVFVADLQQNRLHVLRFDPGTGSFGWCQSLAVGDQAGGPRDVRMRPGGHTLYCANSNATVTVCDFDPGSGQLSEVQTVTVDRGEIRGGRKGGFQSIVLHPRLPVLYGVSRAPGVITSFAVAEDGRLSVRATDDLGCVHSRCLAISPDSRLLVAVGTYDSTLIPFGIEPEYGHLQRLAPVVSSPTPASIVFCYAGPTLVLAMLNRKSAGQRAGGSTRRSVSGAGF